MNEYDRVHPGCQDSRWCWIRSGGAHPSQARCRARRFSLLTRLESESAAADHDETRRLSAPSESRRPRAAGGPRGGAPPELDMVPDDHHDAAATLLAAEAARAAAAAVTGRLVTVGVLTVLRPGAAVTRPGGELGVRTQAGNLKASVKAAPWALRTRIDPARRAARPRASGPTMRRQPARAPAGASAAEAPSSVWPARCPGGQPARAAYNLNASSTSR